MLAAVGAGLFADVREAAVEMTRGYRDAEMQEAVPDAARHGVYTRLYEEVYRGLFPAIQMRLDRLTVLTGQDL